MPSLKKASLTLAEAREAARHVKATRKSKKSPQAARGSKLWERYLGHFGYRDPAPRTASGSAKTLASRAS